MVETMKQTTGQIAVDGGQVISQAKLLELLLYMETHGATFAELNTETEPKMNKTDNPFFGKVIKKTRVNVQLNWVYTNAVNNQRDREGNTEVFEAKPRKWGTFVDNPYTNKVSKTIIEHKGNYYVQARPLTVNDVSFVWVETGKTLDERATAAVKCFIPERNESQTQETDKEIFVSDYKLASLKTVKMFGVLYIIAAE